MSQRAAIVALVLGVQGWIGFAVGHAMEPHRGQPPVSTATNRSARERENPNRAPTTTATVASSPVRATVENSGSENPIAAPVSATHPSASPPTQTVPTALLVTAPATTSNETTALTFAYAPGEATPDRAAMDQLEAYARRINQESSSMTARRRVRVRVELLTSAGEARIAASQLAQQRRRILNDSLRAAGLWRMQIVDGGWTLQSQDAVPRARIVRDDLQNVEVRP